jgi:carboxypeptidase D
MSDLTKGVTIYEMAGMVMDTETQQPIADARVVVEGIEKNITTTARGEYWRLLVPGEYTLQVFAEG